MKMQNVKPFVAGFLAAFLFTGLTAAQAANEDQMNKALSKNDFGALRELTVKNPESVDHLVKSLLKSVQETISIDPAQAQKKISFAAEFAPQITPPTVPSVCADMRRIAEAVPATQAGSPLHQAVMQAAQNFANAPVVVAAGRPNLCEEAWLQVASLSGDDVLLAQSPNRPGYRNYKLGWEPNNNPPNDQPPTDRPSAD